ncbi:hypothetical protein GQ53DRAFT_641051 [Thozetella sp. PMI_491]|nr:hypothetical protein GQ53DRAFT_641051 [Thozetella sp. PMI_491]
MKATNTIVTILYAAVSTAAWKLDLWGTDGRHTSMHGRLDACNDISFTPTINVNRAKFVDEVLDTVSTFELYVDAGCHGLSYRNNGGDFSLVPRKIKSYKVY